MCKIFRRRKGSRTWTWRVGKFLNRIQLLYLKKKKKIKQKVSPEPGVLTLDQYLPKGRHTCVTKVEKKGKMETCARSLSGRPRNTSGPKYKHLAKVPKQLKDTYCLTTRIVVTQ